ncbi:hypothetical protein HGRIS_004179 [Hohenbuehelia grisea]|uniref:F-box domain-containing protein n=1 Tax=Hohenbuehelia grisea TaxID=104357 RepID=A0ABR3JHR1_9AGAR
MLTDGLFADEDLPELLGILTHLRALRLHADAYFAEIPSEVVDALCLAVQSPRFHCLELDRWRFACYDPPFIRLLASAENTLQALHFNGCINLGVHPLGQSPLIELRSLSTLVVGPHTMAIGVSFHKTGGIAATAPAAALMVQGSEGYLDVTPWPFYAPGLRKLTLNCKSIFPEDFSPSFSLFLRRSWPRIITSLELSVDKYMVTEGETAGLPNLGELTQLRHLKLVLRMSAYQALRPNYRLVIRRIHQGLATLPNISLLETLSISVQGGIVKASEFWAPLDAFLAPCVTHGALKRVRLNLGLVVYRGSKCKPVQGFPRFVKLLEGHMEQLRSTDVLQIRQSSN